MPNFDNNKCYLLKVNIFSVLSSSFVFIIEPFNFLKSPGKSKVVEIFFTIVTHGEISYDPAPCYFSNESTMGVR